jgi:predicted anti-sigma-YlaC factor YlaD
VTGASRQQAYVLGPGTPLLNTPLTKREPRTSNGMMQARSATPRDCDRVRQQLSLRLDVECSEFERALLESHLGVCGACRAFASDIEGFTGSLRAAPLVELATPVQLPSQRRRRVSALGSFSAVATVAAIVLSAVAGTHFVRGGTPGSEPRPTHEFTILMEQQLDRLGVAAQPAHRTPAGVAAAEQLAVGQVDGQPSHANSRTNVRHNGGR